MDTRLAALKSIIQILENKQSFDTVISQYLPKVLFPSELFGIVSGTVKYKLTLDYFIQYISSKKIKDLSHNVLNILRLAIYELEFLKTPNYAVLNSYVDLTKQVDKRSGNFVNGVLRNFLRKRKEISYPDIKTEPVKAISIEYSHPEWMVENWVKNYGIEDTIKICEYNNLPPKLVIRVNTLKTSKEDLLELFKIQDIEYSDDRILPDCILLHHPGNIKLIPGYEEGFWIVQSESSSLVSKVLSPQPDETILDLCAAPGGKTTHIAALMSDKGLITAVDISSKRIQRIIENIDRLGIKSVKTIVSDAKTYSSDCLFDRILVDAPCSNTGVLGKRVDARWNRAPKDILDLAKIQLEILNNAAKLLKDDGILVYSTCSIEPEENQKVVKKFIQMNPDFETEDISPFIPWEIEKSGCIQILQSSHNIDGFFISRLRKKNVN